MCNCLAFLFGSKARNIFLVVKHEGKVYCQLCLICVHIFSSHLPVAAKHASCAFHSVAETLGAAKSQHRQLSRVRTVFDVSNESAYLLSKYNTKHNQVSVPSITYDAYIHDTFSASFASWLLPPLMFMFPSFLSMWAHVTLSHPHSPLVPVPFA